MPDPQQQRRAVAYIRESTEEQGRGYSPEGQRQAIARYATDHGLQLVEEYIDFEAGRAADKRPGFQRLIEDAMEHHFDVVLVFHTSRFARNTVEAKRYKKLLRSELGIDVISVTQPLGADANDPAAFLSESVHEIFDEYYSVSLSFWTKMGLREKARQGKLTGSLPWGHTKGHDEIATPYPERAPYVRQLFEQYATGQHTDRTLAAWLNVHEQRTARGRAFGADTIREMLCNAAYCGYANIVDAQLVEFLADFKPAPTIRQEILRRLAGTAAPDTTEAIERRCALDERLRRARDLYELGDLTRPEYMARRDAINTELTASAPGPLPDFDQAQQVLEDFTIFWERETDPAAKRQLLALIFERVWLDEQRIVAVQPKPSFAPYFQAPPMQTAGKAVCKERERRDSNPRPPA